MLNHNHIKALIIIFVVFYFYGSFLYIRNVYRIRKYFKKIKTCRPTILKLEKLAKRINTKLPIIAIFVPARNEGFVIGNTLRRLAKLNYPKKYLKVFVIVDERELDDNVEILTKDVVKTFSTKLNREFKCNFIKCIEIPKWYSGQFGSKKKSYKKSSKGRALNYALQKLRDTHRWDKINIVGILDADGRLDRNVLKEVVHKRLTRNTKLLQGPVFQVSNFDQTSTIGILAGLELGIHHMTRLTHNLLKKKRRLQFLAGTNYFIDAQLIIEVGGWDDNTLVEDAELALRIYAQKKITAEWLSWPEVEQTPPSFSVYKKQRKRWVRGHLDLIDNIKKAKIPTQDKVKMLVEIYMLIFRIFIDLGLPILGWILVLLGISLGLSPGFQLFSTALLAMSIFTWDFYGYMYRKLYNYNYIRSEKNAYKWLQSIKLTLTIPLFIVVQSIPRIQASFNYMFNIGSGIWYKTERTKEIITE